MCGIFGLSLNKDVCTTKSGQLDILKKLFVLSESRGREASGLAVLNADEISVVKSPLTASKFIRSKQFKEFSKNNLQPGKQSLIIGHSRLVTNGFEQLNKNNQPVIRDGIALVHNGIIVNQMDLWKSLNEEPFTELDSEVIPTFINSKFQDNNNIAKSISEFYSSSYGMASIAFIHSGYNNLFLATNNGSIFYCSDSNRKSFVFASEKFIMNRLIEETLNNFGFVKDNISQLEPGYYLIYNPVNHTLLTRKFGEDCENNPLFTQEKTLKVTDYSQPVQSDPDIEVVIPINITENEIAEFDKTVNARIERIHTLKRCSKCILPESFPFIQFDDKGVCNYCNNYKPIDYKGEGELKSLAEKFRKGKNHAECLLPFSGGRDSSYVVHYVVNELNLKPIAFSYDWGMITDLARRNQSRLCGRLGVEHILVSADIRRKRRNIKANVMAWLKNPTLGMVPIFMAGDKQYFYYTNKLLKENELNLSILGENLLETTNFKSGFAGIAPKFGTNKTYSLNTKDKFMMLAYYGAQYLANPAYINRSLWDTIDSFKSYYMISHNNVNLFSYLKWNEKEIIDLLVNEYDWETDPGTETTWRIGDGTAAFYNLIYYMIAGFTENDTFRSNQVREGDISREEALKLSESENRIRWDSLKWYFNTINVDMRMAVKAVLNTKPLF